MLDKLIEREKEKEILYKLVLSIVGVDIKDDNRKRKLVYSRIVFAKILMDNNHDPDSIAIFLGRHRTVMYHYIKIFPTIYHQSYFAKELYNKLYEEFYDELSVNPLRHSREEILENELIKLKVENKRLTNDLIEKELKLKDVKLGKVEGIDVERFMDTFKCITLNVKKGREEILSRKIWNTINTVNEISI
jgi:hypothetical protein